MKIIRKQKTVFKVPVITIGHYIYLTKHASIEFGIYAGCKVKFIIDDGFCVFYKTKNDDPNGFLIRSTYLKGVKIQNKNLIELLRETFNRPDQTFAFPLKKINAEINGEQMIELQTSKIFNRNIKLRVANNNQNNTK